MEHLIIPTTRPLDMAEDCDMAGSTLGSHGMGGARKHKKAMVWDADPVYEL